MPIPESAVMSPEVELLDPEWLNCLPAQRYLSALVKYQDGEIGIDELDLWGTEMVAWWENLDALDELKKAKPAKMTRK